MERLEKNVSRQITAINKPKSGMLNPFRAVFLKWRYIDMYDFSKKKNKKVLAAVVIILVGTMLLTTVLAALL